MDSSIKKILRSLSLELRHTLEGYYDPQGVFHPGDLERRLNELGVWRERPARPLEELPHLAPEDKAARKVIDAYIAYRIEADIPRAEAVAEFVREAAYTWANRLLALRCMEARGIIDEVILQKEAYGGHSLAHHRLARRNPATCAGIDEGLFAVLFAEFETRSAELPELFDPQAPAVALRPSLSALKRCIALLSGIERLGGQDSASDEVFAAPDSLGWAYQYWNSEEKGRVFEKVRTQKVKIEGADIIPATQLYTEPYMVKFLVQNSLGALWMGMHPESKLVENWEYFVKDADRAPAESKPVTDITFLDPAAGSGHFLLEAFDLLFPMYQEETKLRGIGKAPAPEEIAASILNNNLFAIDIDGRAIQIAIAALWMKAKEYAPDLQSTSLTSFHDNLLATDIRLPKGKDHLKAFLEKHPEARPLRPALETIFDGLQNVHELGSLVRIEEPVEKELHYLKEQYDSARGVPEQMVLFTEMRKPRQGELPIGVESFEQWKSHTLSNLGQHFAEEAEAADQTQAFFGQSAYNGLALFKVLSGCYDVVAANPPYMGSKNMGDITKNFVMSHYRLAKRDLFGAFILLGISKCSTSGFIAMVTPDTWTNRVQQRPLRKHILKENQLKIIVALDRHAFDEADPPGLQCLFVIQKELPNINSQFLALSCVGSGRAGAQSERIRSKASGNSQSEDGFWSISHSDISKIPNDVLPVSSGRIAISLLQSYVDAQDYAAGRGLSTGNNPRFIRFWWEISADIWPLTLHLFKSAGYAGYRQPTDYRLKWREKGIDIKQMPGARLQNLHLLGRNDSLIALVGSKRGIISVFHVDEPIVPHDSCFFIPVGENKFSYSIAQYSATRVGAYFFRIIYRGSYAVTTLSFVPKMVERVTVTPSFILWLDIQKEFFSTILESPARKDWENAPVQNILLALAEAATEKYVTNSLGLTNEIEHIYRETPAPIGFLRLITGYDRFPDHCNNFGLHQQIKSIHNQSERILLSLDALLELKAKLKVLYETGPGCEIETYNDDDDMDITQDEEDTELETLRPLPSATFLEELSQKLQIHPISVYWLLKEGIEQEGWRCLPEEKRLAGDTFTVLVLRLFGHRWPKQIEAGEPAPDWADADGIIPLAPVFGEQTLLERVRNRIPDEFPGGSVAANEREFEEIVGEPLERWLSGSFFKRHISQFKKRPIAWHLSSTSANSKQKKGISKAPAFSCLIYYHKLDADLLPKLRTQYAGPLRQRYETELRTLDGIALLTADQSERRIQLGVWIDELRDFEVRLETVAKGGFASPGLEDLLAAEPLDAWTSRDGRASTPETKEAFLLQEQRYDPDLNDGVRVNIAPLQKAGLLAANVLDAKDLDKAIANRAEWRADERRWCREGKLPKPGWWK